MALEPRPLSSLLILRRWKLRPKRRNHTWLDFWLPEARLRCPRTHAKPPALPHSAMLACNAHGAFQPTSLPVSRPGPLPRVPPMSLRLDPLSLKGDASSPTKLFISSQSCHRRPCWPCLPPGITWIRAGTGSIYVEVRGAGSGLPAGFGAARPASILHTTKPFL